MLSQNLIERLNKQIGIELYSSNLYLQMGAWCEANALEGCASFLIQHSEEEMGHMRRLFDFINVSGALVKIGTVKAPRSEFSSVVEVFEEIYQHEIHVTGEINALAKAAFVENDFSTFNFIQWYVEEQREEEHLIKTILDKIKLIGDAENALFFVDEAVRAFAQGQGPATEAV